MPPVPPTSPRTAGIREVARQAGVSIATVSRVFNPGSSVQGDTRERVLALASELGYQPSALGRNLVRGRSELLGVIVPNLAYPLYGAVLQGIEHTLQAHGMSLLLTSSQDDPALELQAARHLQSHSVDSAIVINSSVGHDLPRVRASGWVHLSPETPDLPHRVELDNVQGGRLAAQELLGGGARHLAYVGAPGRESAERERGFAEVLSGHGLDYHRQLGDYSEGSGLALGARLPGNVDGAFVAGDLMAAGVLRALSEAGRQVPGEVAVVGFDDAVIAGLLHPRLTSVRQPAYELGVAAARQALALIAGQAALPVLLQPTLVRRASTRPQATSPP